MGGPKSPTVPSAWVMRFAALIPPGGVVLDLACGLGRHTRLLASMGHQVEAVDRDADAIAALQGIEGVHAVTADLEGGPWPYPGRSFNGIVVTNYLWRPLLPFIIAAIEHGGVLIYETFMQGNELYRPPSNPAFLLRPGELLDIVRGRLNIVAFEQGEVQGDERPAVVQRLCAERGGGALRLP